MGARHRRGRNDDIRALFVLLTASTCVQAARPTASYRTLDLGGTAVAVGGVAASFAVLSAIAAVPIGRIIDRVGPRRFLLGGLTILAAACFGGALAPSIPTLAGSQALLGLGQVSVVVAIQTIAANRPERDRGFARVTVAAGFGQAIGPLLAGALLQGDPTGGVSDRGTALAFVTAGVVVLIGQLVAMWGAGSVPVTPRVESVITRPIPVGTIVRRAGMRQALTTSIAVATAVDLLIAYLPVIGEARSIPPGTIGVFLSLRAISGLSSRMTVTMMLNRLGRQRLLLSAMVMAGLSMLGLALVGEPWAMGTFIIGAGFALGIGAPMTMASVAVGAPEGSRSTAMAVRMTGNRLGQVVLPVVVGGLATAFGPGVVFLFVCASLLGGAAWIRSSPLGEDDQR